MKSTTQFIAYLHQAARALDNRDIPGAVQYLNLALPLSNTPHLRLCLKAAIGQAEAGRLQEAEHHIAEALGSVEIVPVKSALDEPETWTAADVKALIQERDELLAALEKAVHHETASWKQPDALDMALRAIAKAKGTK